MFFNYRVKFPYPRWPHSLYLIQSPSPPDPASPMSLQPVRFPSSRLPCWALAQPAVQSPPGHCTRGTGWPQACTQLLAPLRHSLSAPERSSEAHFWYSSAASDCHRDEAPLPTGPVGSPPSLCCGPSRAPLLRPESSPVVPREPFTSRILIARVITVNACFPG